MKVLLWAEASARYGDLLSRYPLPPNCELVTAATEDEAAAAITDADALICWGAAYPARLANAAPRLRFMQILGAGFDGLLAAGFNRTDIAVANARGANAPPIADHVIALTLAFARKLHVAVRNQATRTWDDRSCRGVEIAGQTFGVLGYGSIGREAAHRAKALGMQVITLARPGRQRPSAVDRETADLITLCAESDYLLVAVPLTHETRAIIGEAELAAMKRSAYLINISRGQTVDENALIRALEAGQLAGAGLDVTAVEPLPADSPLWTIPGVIITPHVAASSPKTMAYVMELVATNLRRFAAGEDPLNLVDIGRGY